MKSRFLNIFIIVLFSCFVGSCGLFKKVQTGNDNTNVVAGSIQNMYQTTHEYKQYQLDSMCVADNLPNDLDQWIKRTYQDYETSVYIDRYIYIKEMNNSYEMVYIVTQKGDIFVVSKRKASGE